MVYVQIYQPIVWLTNFAQLITFLEKAKTRKWKISNYCFLIMHNNCGWVKKCHNFPYLYKKLCQVLYTKLSFNLTFLFCIVGPQFEKIYFLAFPLCKSKYILKQLGIWFTISALLKFFKFTSYKKQKLFHTANQFHNFFWRIWFQQFCIIFDQF